MVHLLGKIQMQDFLQEAGFFKTFGHFLFCKKYSTQIQNLIKIKVLEGGAWE